MTYREDSSRVRTGNAPAVLAAVRNIVTTVFLMAGQVNIAAARRAASLDRPASSDGSPETKPEQSSP